MVVRVETPARPSTSLPRAGRRSISFVFVWTTFRFGHTVYHAPPTSPSSLSPSRFLHSSSSAYAGCNQKHWLQQTLSLLTSEQTLVLDTQTTRTLHVRTCCGCGTSNMEIEVLNSPLLHSSALDGAPPLDAPASVCLVCLPESISVTRSFLRHRPPRPEIGRAHV